MSSTVVIQPGGHQTRVSLAEAIRLRQERDAEAARRQAWIKWKGTDRRRKQRVREQAIAQGLRHRITITQEMVEDIREWLIDQRYSEHTRESYMKGVKFFATSYPLKGIPSTIEAQQVEFRDPTAYICRSYRVAASRILIYLEEVD